MIAGISLGIMLQLLTEYKEAETESDEASSQVHHVASLFLARALLCYDFQRLDGEVKGDEQVSNAMWTLCNYGLDQWGFMLFKLCSHMS